MPVQYCIILHNHILTRFSATATIFVFTRLDTNRIISRIKYTVDNQRILARFQINRVTILWVPWIDNHNIINREIFAGQRMQTPARRVLESYAFQQHFLAFHNAEQHRTQPRTDFSPFFICINPFGYVEIFASHSPFQRTCGGIPYLLFLIQDTARIDQFLPLWSSQFLFLHRTPAISVTIKRAIAGDSDILRIPCRDRWLATTGFQPFKRSVDDRICFEVACEKYQCILFCIKIHITQQLDRTGQPDTFRDNHFPPTTLVDVFDRIIDRLCIQE